MKSKKNSPLFFCVVFFILGLIGIPVFADSDVRLFLDISHSSDLKHDLKTHATDLKSVYKDFFKAHQEQIKPARWGLALFASKVNFVLPVQARTDPEQAFSKVIEGIKPWGTVGDWLTALERGTHYPQHDSQSVSKHIWLWLSGHLNHLDEASWQKRSNALIRHLKLHHVALHVVVFPGLKKSADFHRLETFVHQLGGQISQWHQLGDIPTEGEKPSVIPVAPNPKTNEVPPPVFPVAPAVAVPPPLPSAPLPAVPMKPALSKTVALVPADSDGQYSFPVTSDAQEIVISIDKVSDAKISQTATTLVTPDGKSCQASDPALRDPNSPIQWKQIGEHELITLHSAQKGRWAIQGAGVSVQTVSVHANVKWRMSQIPAIGRTEEPFDVKVHAEGGDDRIINPDLLKLWDVKAQLEKDGKPVGDESSLTPNSDGLYSFSGRWPADPGIYGVKMKMKPVGGGSVHEEQKSVEVRAVEPGSALGSEMKKTSPTTESREIHLDHQKVENAAPSHPESVPSKVVDGAISVEKKAAASEKTPSVQEPKPGVVHPADQSEKLDPSATHSTTGLGFSPPSPLSGPQIPPLKSAEHEAQKPVKVSPLIYRILLVFLLWATLLGGGFLGWKWWKKKHSENWEKDHGIEPTLSDSEHKTDGSESGESNSP